MKKNKKAKYTRFAIYVAVISLATFGLLLFGGVSNTERHITSETQKIQRKTIYPLQYSDRHPTLNAKITDERFKNLSLFVEKDNLLGNAISSISNGPKIQEDRAENATWLWTPIVYITPKYADEIISGAKKNGINTIYLSIDTYLDVFVMPLGEEKEKAKDNFDKTIESFIKLANENGIEVDAEAGWQNWAEKGNSYKPDIILDYVINYNKTHEAKFRGFQYDVEVYLLPEYKENKEKILKNFLVLIDGTLAKLDGTDLLFGVVIPEFYDGSTDETPKFKYKGKDGFVYDHLLSSLERREGSSIIIMSYRNFSTGFDGTIEISKHEIEKSNKTKVKVIVAQETGNVPPPYITFFNTSKNYYNKQLALVYDAFQDDKSFGGTAVHFINSFLELK